MNWLGYYLGSYFNLVTASRSGEVYVWRLVATVASPAIFFPCVGCRGAGDMDQHTEPHVTCASDSACPEGFCDRGMCAAYSSNVPYGAPCAAPPAGGYNPCGAYVCVDHRCRSCVADSECGSPVSTCNHYPGDPGRACGRVVDPGPVQPSPPRSAIPAPPTSP